MDIFSLDAEIKKLILLRQEGEYWDFKKEWHINKADLLHDIICMANNPSPHDEFIVIGINEETHFSVYDVVNDPNRRKTQDMVTFLRDKNSPAVFGQRYMFSLFPLLKKQ